MDSVHLGFIQMDGDNMKNILLVLFVVRVLVPMNIKVYNNVQSWVRLRPESYTLVLTDGTTVIVPTMWTVIEEVKDNDKHSR